MLIGPKGENFFDIGQWNHNLLILFKESPGIEKLVLLSISHWNHILSEGWNKYERGEYKEKVWEGECGRNIMYLCMKTEKWDLSKLF
jgi:hypothetical protein